MTRYRLPEVLGGGEYDEVVITGAIASCRGFIVNGHSVAIHRALLERVPPPTPAEPQPGAYRVGDTLCWRDTHAGTGDPDENYCWRLLGRPSWRRWVEVWHALGGPDVTITALIPAPPEVTELMLLGRGAVTLDSEAATRIAHALLTAARAT